MRRLWLPFLLGSLTLFNGCSKKPAANTPPGAKGYSDIRSVDFRNFDYPQIPGWMKTEIQLRDGFERNLFRDRDGKAESDSPSNGQASLGQVLYGYGPGSQPIALVVVDVDSGGTMTVSEIFLYKLQDSAPRLKWSFETGDRADGGLRSIYFESGSGDLVVELYQEDSDDPLCCASRFSRHFYNWRNDQLLEIRKEDWIPLPKQPGRIAARSLSR